MKIDKEVLKGYVDTIILSLLYEKDMYGYELSKKVKEESNGAFELKEGTLYLAFKRLENNGYAQSYWDESHGGGRRKYYTISPHGIQYLMEKKQEWNFLKEIMNHFLKGVEDHESGRK
jgi:PadR family transcriptional regulator PadR